MHVEPGADEIGWLASAGRVPLGYLGDAERTVATFPVIQGRRFSVSGDRARFRSDGRIAVLGRASSVINTGGEKVFAEEVEAVVREFPAVADVVVVAGPSERWGQEVVALVAGSDAVDVAALLAHCRGRLAGYKVPEARRDRAGHPPQPGRQGRHAVGHRHRRQRQLTLSPLFPLWRASRSRSRRRR